jgi:hypothetical protein
VHDECAAAALARVILQDKDVESVSSFIESMGRILLNSGRIQINLRS